MSEVLLSAFNPSTMSPQLLEAIFVEREPLVQELLRSIRGSLSPTSKAHSLILGPRGMGKTHLVSLIYHRIREGKKGAEGMDEHLRIAWLREEERGIATFFHLLRRIIVVLAATYKDPELERCLADLKGNSPQDTQVLAERLLVEWLRGKTLLLLVENFEDMLHRMGEQGQQAFRAFLQNRSCCLVLATAPTLTAALSKQTAPFYNFFNLHTLEEFDVETARGLMRLIAQQRGDKEFADFLETPIATERLRAIEDLAGGHPRIWILFAGFLTKEILDDLVPAFYKLVDELTPYYHSKMKNLPSQEALIIETLCEKPGAMPVKELADACFLAQNAVSAHLNDLTKRGFVRSEKLGRESYYELREPLLRVWIQVKGDRNKPVKLIIEFIKRWFSIEKIEEVSKIDHNEFILEKQYFTEALKEIKDSEIFNLELASGFFMNLYNLDYNASLNYSSKMFMAIHKQKSFINDKFQKMKKSFHVFYDYKNEKPGSIEFLILTFMFFGESHQDNWVSIATDLLRKSKDLKRSDDFMACFVEAIMLMFKPATTDDMARKWLSAWQKAGAGYEELEIPLRMLAAAVEWKKTRSRAALLRLEPELRSKLESLLPPEASVVETPRRKR